MLRRHILLACVSLLCGCSLSSSATGVVEDSPRDASSRPPREPIDTPTMAESTDDEDSPPPPPPEEPVAPSTMMDATMVKPLDATVRDAARDSVRDAGRDASAYGSAATRNTCAGSDALGHCWYLGARGLSCAQVCADHGGFDSAAVDLVGTRLQGGSLENCSEVLGALGVTGPVGAAARFDGVGVGCHRWGDLNYWLISSFSPFTEYTSADPAEIACACAR